MAIYNFGPWEAKKLPTLDAALPADMAVTAGDDTLFVASVIDAGAPKAHSFQWYVDGDAVEGATEDTYVRDTSGDKGILSVWCEVTNKAGTVRTRDAVLTVKKSPVLDTSYPVNVSCILHDSIDALSVRVAEAGYPDSYTYQWYKNDVAIDGATSPTYPLSTSEKGTREYHCVVTNEAGSVTSRTAMITVDVQWLYKDGTEYVEVGFLNPVGYELPFNTNYVKHSTYALMSGNGGAAGHALYAYADATKFSKFCVEMTMTGQHLNNGGICVTEHGNYYYPAAVAGITFDATTQYTSRTVFSIDISQLTGGKYFWVGSWSSHHDLAVYRMWLE